MRQLWARSDGGDTAVLESLQRGRQFAAQNLDELTTDGQGRVIGAGPARQDDG